MENRPVRFRFMPGPPSPRQRQKLHGERGHTSNGPSRRSDWPEARRPVSAPVKFVRNPKYPKNLYAAEMSLRHIIKGKPVKVSSDMSFPDPKNGKSIRNPKAPRFRHEFDPTEKDYDIITNPLATAGAESVHALIPDTADDDNNNFIYVDDSDDSGSNDSHDGATRFSIIDDNTDIFASEIDSTLVRMQEEESLTSYSEVHKTDRGHLVRETPSMMETDVPEFAPQPPPPRGPKAVLVLPRAVVREDVSHRNRVRGNGQNGELTYSNIGP